MSLSHSGWRGRSSIDGFTAEYDYALQTMTDVPYNKWREYDPEDTIRFYALRLQEAGMIKSTPQTDNRQRHGLAIPRRTKARDEDMSRWPARMLLLLALLAGAAHAHDAQHNERLPTIGPAPDFALTSQDGARVSLTIFAAKRSPSPSSTRPVPTSARC